MQTDVVCIGAINYDYVYDGELSVDETPPKKPEQGREELDADPVELDALIDRATMQGLSSQQVGGSAYLAAKTIFSMNCGLEVGFVGVLGTGNANERGHGLTLEDVKKSVHDTSWLFESTAPVGRSLVHTQRGQRAAIRITPGANLQLMELIEGRRAGLDGLVDYLAGARWVHVTSLPTFPEFSLILEGVALAKARNRSLRCSIDPGYDYVKKHREALIGVLSVADLVFLSGGEAELLFPPSFTKGRSRFAGVSDEGPSKLIVIKGKDENQLVERLNGATWVRKFWHRRLRGLEIKNDTGAGDVFAGGFIASILMDSLLGSQPSASELAAELAAERLKNHEFPSVKLRIITEAFIRKNRALEFGNRRQRLENAWETYRSLVWFLAGVIITYPLTRLMDLIYPLGAR